MTRAFPAFYALLFSLLIGLIPDTSQANNGHLPALAGPCPAGSKGISNQSGICWITGETMDGTALFGKNGQFKSGQGITTQAEFADSYVPFTGMYKIREHICMSTVQAKCTLADSSMFIDSAKSNRVSSAESINAQRLDWGGNAMTLSVPYAFNMCFTLVSDDGAEWSARQGTECSDAHILGETPSVCSLNYNEDLTVALGTLERSSIPDRIGASSSTVKKSIPVMCSGDAALNVSIKFQYTPLSIGGSQAAKTSTGGLGVAIFYDGKAMSTSDSKSLSLGNGVNQIDLEFAAVRDPEMSAEQIATGDFTADAVLILTEQ